MEASGAADITTTVKPDSDSATASEDVSLEVTSSAASSLKVSGSGGTYSCGDSPALF